MSSENDANQQKPLASSSATAKDVSAGIAYNELKLQIEDLVSESERIQQRLTQSMHAIAGENAKLKAKNEELMALAAQKETDAEESAALELELEQVMEAVIGVKPPPPPQQSTTTTTATKNDDATPTATGALNETQRAKLRLLYDGVNAALHEKQSLVTSLRKTLTEKDARIELLIETATHQQSKLESLETLTRSFEAFASSAAAQKDELLQALQRNQSTFKRMEANYVTERRALTELEALNVDLKRALEQKETQRMQALREREQSEAKLRAAMAQLSVASQAAVGDSDDDVGDEQPPHAVDAGHEKSQEEEMAAAAADDEDELSKRRVEQLMQRLAKLGGGND